MVDFDAIEVGQAFVPVVRVSLHYPDLVLDPPLRLKGTGARDVEDLAQIVIIFFQHLLAEDHVPAAGEGGHHEIDGAWRGQLEFDCVFVARVDLADRPEQRGARDADAGRRFRDAVEGRLYVSRCEIRPVVELDTLAQVKRVGLAVLRDFPAMRQIGDDGLATVARITPDQVVEHAALSADVADSARLMHVEMRGAIENAVAHHPSPLWIGLRCRYLKLRAVVLHRNIGGEAVAWGQTVSPHQRGCATTKHIAAGPTGTCGMPNNHDAGILLWIFSECLFIRHSPGSREFQPWSPRWAVGATAIANRLQGNWQTVGRPR